MRVVALMTVRNEELYLERCIRHLQSQGVEACIIDNGSIDGTRAIAESYLGRGVMRIEDLPFTGQFELARILRNEERLAGEIDADWFMHHDADEIREAPRGFATLVDGVVAADRQGYNAINFDEFVFVPTGEDEDYERSDYVAAMKHYYFFEPAPMRRLNLWKNTGQPVDLVSKGGHVVRFANRRVFPQSFVMRHYIVLSKAHAIRKYGDRRFSATEVGKGWHSTRATFSELGLRFPDRSELHCIEPGGAWEKGRPQGGHLIFPGQASAWVGVKRLVRRVLHNLRHVSGAA